MASDGRHSLGAIFRHVCTGYQYIGYYKRKGGEMKRNEIIGQILIGFCMLIFALSVVVILATWLGGW